MYRFIDIHMHFVIRENQSTLLKITRLGLRTWIHPIYMNSVIYLHEETLT